MLQRMRDNRHQAWLIQVRTYGVRSVRRISSKLEMRWGVYVTEAPKNQGINCRGRCTWEGFRWTLRAVVTHACRRPTIVNCHYGVRLVTCISPVHRSLYGLHVAAGELRSPLTRIALNTISRYKLWTCIIRALFIPMWLLHKRTSLAINPSAPNRF